MTAPTLLVDVNRDTLLARAGQFDQLTSQVGSARVAPSHHDWPLPARKLWRLRIDTDVGIGDTIHRLLGRPGSWFELAIKSLGIQCGCQDRRAWLNQRFPY